MKRDRVLIDTGILVAFYDAADPHHRTVFDFLEAYLLILRIFL
jgi:predicted nucleic acid-binding protein